jgi:pseudouridine-5'-phosphate glycosidase
VNPYLDIRPEVAAALARGGPVVALESTVISHGLPRPHNFETAQRMEAAVRKEGVVPATVGLLNGKLIVGLSTEEIELLANTDGIHKVSRRDISAVLQARKPGATTVAATMLIASHAGIQYSRLAGSVECTAACKKLSTSPPISRNSLGLPWPSFAPAPRLFSICPALSNCWKH